MHNESSNRNARQARCRENGNDELVSNMGMTSGSFECSTNSEPHKIEMRNSHPE
jgi:hypothetical protein